MSQATAVPASFDDPDAFGAWVDGLEVRGPGAHSYRPDVIVTCGPRLRGEALRVEEPTILVEVLSPSTGGIDTGIKLASYLTIPSMRHYLVVSSQARLVLHHRRSTGSDVLTGVARAGAIDLDSPGIGLTFEEIYEGTSLGLQDGDTQG